VTGPIPVVPDIPTDDPRLGFPGYARALADAVLGVEPAQATIGIYGRWGSGKTSLLRAIKRYLEEEGNRVIPVLFEAWRYEQSGPVIVPLLYQVLKSISARGSPAADQFKKITKALIASFKITIGGMEFDPSEAYKVLSADGLDSLDATFARPYEELNELSASLDGTRICVLIDDLDRCSPGNLVATLEAINVVLDTPGIVYVLALDYDVLVQAVSARYPHVSGDGFVEKLIQLPFRVPPLALPRDSFLSSLITEKTLSYLPAGFSAYSRDIAILALGSNPRQIKRFVSSYLVLRAVAVSRPVDFTNEALAALVGLQLGWPANYSKLVQAIQSGDEASQEVLLSGDPAPALGKYVQRYFPGRDSLAGLGDLILLTKSLVVPVNSPAEESWFSQLENSPENARAFSRAAQRMAQGTQMGDPLLASLNDLIEPDK
jgi:KAP family P-loop domain